MRIEKVRLKDANVKRIYFDAFPKKERMPFFLMVAMSKLWNTQFLSFYDGDILCGTVYFARNRKLVFVMFLAVEERFRSKGYGSAILQAIKNRYPNRKKIVTIEPCDANAPDFAQRWKRKALYLHNGYGETGYRMRLNGVEQEILLADGAFDKRELRSFLAIYSNGILYPQIWKATENFAP